MVGVGLDARLVAGQEFPFGIHAFDLSRYVEHVEKIMMLIGVQTGEIHHVMQEIIVGGGMLTDRSVHDKPIEKFNAFLASLEWPGSVGRLPTKV